MLKTNLQALTNCKSESLSILFRNFEEKFPQEKGCIALLRDKIFNEIEFSLSYFKIYIINIKVKYNPADSIINVLDQKINIGLVTSTIKIYKIAVLFTSSIFKICQSGYIRA